VTEVLVYAAVARAQTARTLLAAACDATGIGARLEVYGSGSLYQRLGPRHAPPLPDVVLWSGPFAAQAAGLDGLLQPHPPARVADGAAHDPSWRWTALDYSAARVVGSTSIDGWQNLTNVPKLALADPERSESGLIILVCTLDLARQAESDAERGWAWWQQRARTGLVLAEDDAGALAMVGDAGASHALSLSSADVGSPVVGLAPIPNAVGVAASARNVDAARRLVDWLVGESAAGGLRLSPWQAASNGLAALASAAPVLDVDWCRQQYTAARRRWAQSGMGPVLGR
jgi:ABC-type Fe3+ transport system substrate-binding protein